MRVLGIDPGSRLAGYGVIEKVSVNSINHIGSGCIKLESKVFSNKLSELYAQLNFIIDELKPTCMAVEKAFLGKNVDSAFKLGQVRGVCLLIAGQRNLPVYEYAAKSIKKQVTGQGGASKEHVKAIVEADLGVRIDDTFDVSDALAIAMTHVFSSARNEKLQALGV